MDFRPPDEDAMRGDSSGDERTPLAVEPRVGQPFGSYQIVRLLGEGGMGRVFEAQHADSGRRVALKVLRRSFGVTEDHQRFLREGRLAAQVNHPNSVYV